MHQRSKSASSQATGQASGTVQYREGVAMAASKQEKNKGQVRHSLGDKAGNVPTTDIDESQRTVLRGKVYEQPGTTERRAPRTRAKARQQAMPGRSMRAERAAADKAAAAKAAKEPTLDELFAQLDKEVAAIQRAKEHAAKQLVDRRAKVWQLQSWTEGGKPCPDELLGWEG